ncbi:MAG: hypothetical protein ACUVQ1_01175 [Candidatus Kapaibacteriales bacterium]
MKTQELFNLEEKRFLVELLKRTLAERKPIYDAYQKYIEKLVKFDRDKMKLERVIKNSNKK